MPENEQEQHEVPRITDKRGSKEPMTQEQMESLNAERIDAKRAWVIEHAKEVDPEGTEILNLENLQDWPEATIDSCILHIQHLSHEEGQPASGPEVRSVYAAFVVIVDFDGSAYATADLTQELDVETVATPYHMFSACSHVIRDLQAIENAKHVMMGIQQTAARAGQMRQAQATARGLGLAGDQPRRR